MPLTVNLKALLVAIVFWAVLSIGLDVRLGLAAAVAAAVSDWLFVAAPFVR